MFDIDFDLSCPLRCIYREIERLKEIDNEEVKRVARRLQLYVNDIAEAVGFSEDEDDNDNEE